MKDEVRDQRGVSGWAWPASLLAHGVIAALVIFGLPSLHGEPEPEQAVTVELVPPPPEEQAAPAPPAEEAKPQAAKQAEAKPSPAVEDAPPDDSQDAKAEPAPPADKAKPDEEKAESGKPEAEKKAEEAAKKAEAAAEKAEQAKAEEAAKKAEEQAKAEAAQKAEEQAKAEAAAAEELAKAEAQAKDEAAAAEELAKAEEQAKAEAAAEQAKAEAQAKAEEAQKQEQAKAEEAQAEEQAKAEAAKAEELAKAGSAAGDEASSLSMLQPVLRYGETDAGPRQAPNGNGAEAGAAPPKAETDTPAGQPALPLAGPGGVAPGDAVAGAVTPPAHLATTPDSQTPPKDVTKLFSMTDNGAAVATTAMGDVPRGVRAGRLCVTALRDQLRNGLPPYFPDILPAYRLESGTVLDIPKAAFRVGGQWFDLSYRCAVDEAATRVVGFSYRVGAPLPPSEWRRRGLPAR